MRRILHALTFLLLGCVACSLATAAPGRTAVAGSPTSKVEKMIDVGGRRLHACFYGQGAPAVVLLSGANAPQAYWDPIVAQVAEKTTVVTYDRAGLWDPRLPVPLQKGGGRAAQPPSSWPVVQTEPECNDLTWRQVETITSYPRVPLTVITAGILQSPPSLAAAALQQAKERRKFDQEALTRIIPGGKHVLLPDVGHDVIHQAPAAVMGEILEMVGRIASLPGKPTQEPPQGQAPKLSENLSALEPFIGPTWIGSVPNDPRLGEIVLKWDLLLNGQAVRLRRSFLHSDHLLETTYYWDASSAKIAFLALSNYGVVIKGHVSVQGNELIAEGAQRGPGVDRKSRRIYKLDRNGTLYEDDQFRTSDSEEWRRSHISVFVAKGSK